MSCEGNGLLVLRGRHSLVQFNLLFMRMILPRNISLNIRLVFSAYLPSFYEIGVCAAVLLSIPKAARAVAFNGPVGGDPLFKLRPIPTLDVGVRGALISSSDYQPPKHKSLSDGE